MISAPPSPDPDSKKKRAPLPSLLSNLRNARQAVVGRASDAAEDLLYERELRPLTGGGGGSSGALELLGSTSTSGGGPQHLQRGVGGGVGGVGAPPSSISSGAATAAFTSTMQNFSQRFGNKFRRGSNARSRRKKGSGVTVVPQEFYLAVGCFFFAFPIFFMIYIYIAGHSVFGDGSNDGHQIMDVGLGVNQTGFDGDNSQGMLIEDEMDNVRDRLDDSIPDVETLGQNDQKKFTKRNIDSSLTEDNTNDLTGDEDGNASAMKAVKSGNFKGTLNNPKSLSVRERDEVDGNTQSSLDQSHERRRA